MAVLASARFRNHSSVKLPSRHSLLIILANAFCHGLPRSINAKPRDSLATYLSEARACLACLPRSREAAGAARRLLDGPGLAPNRHVCERKARRRRPTSLFQRGLAAFACGHGQHARCHRCRPRGPGIDLPAGPRIQEVRGHAGRHRIHTVWERSPPEPAGPARPRRPKTRPSAPAPWPSWTA